MKLYGCEIEKTIARVDSSAPALVGPDFFTHLERLARGRSTFSNSIYSDLEPERRIGIQSTDLGAQGLDNGFGLLETALPPLASLTDLAHRQVLDLRTVQESLRAEGATTINMSIHPLGRRDLESYRIQVAPKGGYRYLWYRGWDHTAGMDGRSQCSPSTSVSIEDAARAVSVIIGAAAAFIALSANSPFEEGRPSGLHESRLTIWERMFRRSRAESDRRCARFPDRPFHSLTDYFTWMFGDGTTMYFVLETGVRDYRGAGDSLILIEGEPSLFDYFAGPARLGFRFVDLMGSFPPKQSIAVTPSLRHLELLQWTQFAGARIRFQLRDHDAVSPRELVAACRGESKQSVEELLAPLVTAMWIEGRDPGANFPDAELWEEDDAAARTVMIAPAACQAGLLRNLEAAHRFISSYSWTELGALRDAAITHGLDGATEHLTVRRFTERLLEIAMDGLSSEDRRYLDYYSYVLRTGRSGAVRQIEWLNRYAGGDLSRLPELIRRRYVVTPEELSL